AFFACLVGACQKVARYCHPQPATKALTRRKAQLPLLSATFATKSALRGPRAMSAPALLLGAKRTSPRELHRSIHESTPSTSAGRAPKPTLQSLAKAVRHSCFPAAARAAAESQSRHRLPHRPIGSVR